MLPPAIMSVIVVQERIGAYFAVSGSRGLPGMASCLRHGGCNEKN